MKNLSNVDFSNEVSNQDHFLNILHKNDLSTLLISWVKSITQFIL